jgi:hypothetical protein
VLSLPENGSQPASETSCFIKNQTPENEKVKNKKEKIASEKEGVFSLYSYFLFCFIKELSGGSV